jgi:hypothetical protein
MRALSLLLAALVMAGCSRPTSSDSRSINAESRRPPPSTPTSTSTTPQEVYQFDFDGANRILSEWRSNPVAAKKKWQPTRCEFRAKVEYISEAEYAAFQFGNKQLLVKFRPGELETLVTGLIYTIRADFFDVSDCYNQPYLMRLNDAVIVRQTPTPQRPDELAPRKSRS